VTDWIAIGLLNVLAVLLVLLWVERLGDEQEGGGDGSRDHRAR
jgi:hypothetical protein